MSYARSERRESNPGPLAPKASALPLRHAPEGKRRKLYDIIFRPAETLDGGFSAKGLEGVADLADVVADVFPLPEKDSRMY